MVNIVSIFQSGWNTVGNQKCWAWTWVWTSFEPGSELAHKYMHLWRRHSSWWTNTRILYLFSRPGPLSPSFQVWASVELDCSCVRHHCLPSRPSVQTPVCPPACQKTYTFDLFALKHSTSYYTHSWIWLVHIFSSLLDWPITSLLTVLFLHQHCEWMDVSNWSS